MRPSHPPGLLVQLAEMLGRTISEQGTDATVGLLNTDAGLEVHLRHTQPGEHVSDLLLGFDAPAQWSAIGVMATGRSRSLEEPGAPQRSVVVVHLHARSGQSVSLLGPPGGPLEASSTPAQGRVVDLCRRCLGLGTDAAHGSPLQWWVACWLDRLSREPASEMNATEAQLVKTFPGGVPFGSPPDLASLAEHARLLEASCPWPVLRSAVVAGAVAAPGIEPAAAAWMDDGMFQRWALEEVPPISLTLAEVQARLPPRLSLGVAALVSSLELGVVRTRHRR